MVGRLFQLLVRLSSINSPMDRFPSLTKRGAGRFSDDR